MTIIDFVQDKKLRDAIVKEFEMNRRGYKYRSLMR